MSDLKPCPFCGGEVQLCNIDGDRSYEFSYYYEIVCRHCGLSNKSIYANRDRVENAAIEHWNTRPIDDALRKKISQLQADNRSLVEQMNQMAMNMDHKSGNSPKELQIMSNILREMVIAQLKALGADGLVCPCEDCGCGIEELGLCECPNLNDCVAAKWRACFECEHNGNCAMQSRHGIATGCFFPMPKGANRE